MLQIWSREYSIFQVMSELADDGSMARNEKNPWSTRDNNKEVLLQELQKSVHFVKTMGPSHIPNVDKPMFCTMALPVWFVTKHGDKFQQTVLLWSGLSTKPWRVQLTICDRPPKAPEVKFGDGWRSFSASHGLIEGDDLLFSLRAMSQFDVYVFRETGNPVKPSSFQAPRKRSQDFQVSQEKQKSGGCGDLHLNAESSEASVDGFSESFAKKKRGGEEGAVFAFHGRSKAGRSSASNFDLHYLEPRNLRDPSSLCCDSHQGREPPIREHEELEKPCAGDDSAQCTAGRKSNANEYKDKAVEETRKLPSPSFVKRVTASNFCNTKRAARLEIPKDFVRMYGSGLHRPIVKLQGIHERCPVRVVVCARWKQDGEIPSRLYLTDGWSEFGDENGLEVGQELIFTLTADSFFVVRANS